MFSDQRGQRGWNIGLVFLTEYRVHWRSMMQVLGVQDYPHLFPSMAVGTVKLVQILVDALFIKADLSQILRLWFFSIS